MDTECKSIDFQSVLWFAAIWEWDAKFQGGDRLTTYKLLEDCTISEKIIQRKSVDYFPFFSLLSNLWWMWNSTSKGFEPVIRTASSRQLLRYITGYGWVSSPVSLAAVALSWRYGRILYHRGVECKMQSWNLMIMYCMRSKRRHDKVYSIKEEKRDIHFVPWQLRE